MMILMDYNFIAIICDGLCEGNFEVEAFSYAEAFDKAKYRVERALKQLPDGLKPTYKVVLNYTNADKFFEEKLKIAIDEFGADSIKITYDEENDSFCIMYCSPKNSFSIFNIHEDDFVIKNEEDVESWLYELANLHHCKFSI